MGENLYRVFSVPRGGFALSMASFVVNFRVFRPIRGFYGQSILACPRFGNIRNISLVKTDSHLLANR